MSAMQHRETIENVAPASRESYRMLRLSVRDLSQLLTQ
jgi:hypothetical protein